MGLYFGPASLTHYSDFTLLKFPHKDSLNLYLRDYQPLQTPYLKKKSEAIIKLAVERFDRTEMVAKEVEPKARCIIEDLVKGNPAKCVDVAADLEGLPQEVLDLLVKHTAMALFGCAIAKKRVDYP